MRWLVGGGELLGRGDPFNRNHNLTRLVEAAQGTYSPTFSSFSLEQLEPGNNILE